MSRATLLAIVAKFAATVTDSAGFHFHPPQAALDAITDGVIADNVFGDEVVTAAVLIVFGIHESGLSINPRGSNDNGRACGPWQHHASGEECLRLRRDWAFATRTALIDFRRSALANSAHPFAAYCGSPTGAVAIRISDSRAAEARALVAMVPVDGGGR